MRSGSIYGLTIFINFIINLIGYIMGAFSEDFYKTSTIYWCLVILIISLTSATILDKLVKLQEENDTIKGNLSTLLIKKDIRSKGYSVTVYPKIYNDKLTVKEIASFTLTTNSIYDLPHPPSLTIESNFQLDFQMPDVEITNVEHVNKFIYYFKDIKQEYEYYSKRFFSYKVDLIPLHRGEHELKFIVEDANFKSEELFTIKCER